MKRARWVCCTSSAHRALARWLLACAFCFVLPALTVHAQSELTLERAEFLLSDASAPPPDSAPWQALRLPDNWNVSRPGVGGFGWYRLRFALPQRPDALWSLYLRKLSMNAAVYLNGAFVFSGGRFEEPVARHWNRPLLVDISPALLRAGSNTLHVRLYAYPNTRGGIDTLVLGAKTRLHPQWELRYFVQTILPQLCNIVVAALGVFAFALWIKHRREPMYPIFAVFALLWAVRAVHTFARDIPVSAFYWDIWVQSSFGWCGLLFVVFAMRFANLRSKWFERALVVYAVSGPLAMYLAGAAQLHRVANNWSFLIVPVAIAFEVLLVRAAWRNRTLSSATLASAWALIILASVHDGLVHRGKLAFDSFYFVSYAMVLFALAIGWILVRRFTDALSEAEALNLELERRVAQKHAELEQNFARLQDMQRSAAVAEERRRLMSEMHDGVGSQVIAALDAVERGTAQPSEIAHDLREILDSLRLTIDSLQPSENDLLTVLGNLRYRLEGRLKRQGIRLDWQVSDLPELPALTPQNVLHILRILQECFTNIIKHAQADTITVQTAIESKAAQATQQVLIRVADNGHGFAHSPATNPAPRQGRGLAGMRQRARQLGAQLQIETGAGGTVLSLRIPSSPSEPPAPQVAQPMQCQPGLTRLVQANAKA